MLPMFCFSGIGRAGRPTRRHNQGSNLKRSGALFGLVAGLAMAAAPAHAQEFCSEPIAPSCLTAGMNMDSTLQVRRCEEDLNRYEQNFKQYADCQTRKLDGMRGEIAEFHDVLEKWMADAARAEGAPTPQKSEQNSGQEPGENPDENSESE